MDVVTIKVADFLYNMGNTIFNIKDAEYGESNDLDYEESNALPINKIFYSLDEKSKYYEGRTHLLMTIFLNFFKFIFSKIKLKPKKKVRKKTISNYRNSNFNNCNTAHSVVSNNVRNRLLKTINEDINVHDNNVKSGKFPKPQKLKNQFKSDIVANENIEDESNFSNGILNRLSVFVNRFI